MTLPDRTFGPRAKCRKGTEHLRRHMYKCMPAHEHVDITTHTQLQRHLDGSVTTWQFNVMHVRECLARYIAQTDQPISVETYEITYRILSITLDNAPANTSSIALFVIRNIPQDGGYFFHQRFSEFKRHCKLNSLKPRRFQTDMPAILQIVEMSEVLNSYREDEHLGTAVVAIETKLKKYWANIPLLYALSLIVDLRVKVSGLEVLLEFISTNLSIDYSEQITGIRTKLFEIFRIYDSTFGNIDTPKSTQPEIKLKQTSLSLLKRQKKRQISKYFFREKIWPIFLYRTD
ncbi:hypothetical protein Ddye_020913 [Dipteronia dyeriana]|uniref:Uncharacterized protein n=1 Tax=Dipteronia dyeriana TaxID=168575 RepID=A0AAD9U128_9ROSI|nr:hypothetical protein Ddye_020913 [Dipteronia dyeriana]